MRTSFRAMQNAVETKALLTGGEYVTESTLHQQRVQRRSRWGTVCLFLLAVTLGALVFGSWWNTGQLLVNHTKVPAYFAPIANSSGLK